MEAVDLWYLNLCVMQATFSSLDSLLLLSWSSVGRFHTQLDEDTASRHLNSRMLLYAGWVRKSRISVIQHSSSQSITDHLFQEHNLSVFGENGVMDRRAEILYSRELFKKAISR